MHINYWFETWSLILREKLRLRVFENRVLRRVFGPKREEVTGEWRKLYNEQLNDLYSSPNIIRVIKSRRLRWAGHVARMGERRYAYRILVGKREGKRLPVKPKHRWKDNITMYLQEVGLGGMGWIDLDLNRGRWRAFVKAVMNLRVPTNAVNSLTYGEPVSFSRRTLFHGVSKNKTYVVTCLTARNIQGGSNMTGTDLYVNKPHCAAAVRP